MPFPQRAARQKVEEQMRKFVSHLSKLHINLPFLDAIKQIPGYAKCLKQLLMNKRTLAELDTMVLEEVSSAAVTGKLPKKRQDPGSFTIPCVIGDLSVSHALADSGASINLMPSSMYAKLNLGEPKPIRMKIELADKSVIRPVGILEDVLVKVGSLVFPVDFIIIDVGEETKVPLILGRPFLATADANIEVGRGKLTLRVGQESITFVNQSSVILPNAINSVESAFVNSVDVQIDEWLDKKLAGENVDRLEKEKSTKKLVVKDRHQEPHDPNGPSTKIRKLYSRVKSAISHGNFRLSEDLCDDLSSGEKEELMMVVDSTWRANDWVLTKVKGTRFSPFKWRPPNTPSVGASDTPPG